jgi:nickel-dependent lactate racemase
LRQWLTPGCKICITFTDITRATPNERLIPWLLEYLRRHGAGNEQIVLLNQMGTHRPNTHTELERILTPGVVRDYRVVNHEPENPDALVQCGTTRGGAPVLLNRHLVSADVRIITGFIEPHLFAGFSGGIKGIIPGVAGLTTVVSNHSFHHLSDPNATFGKTNGNPLWEELRDIALRVGDSFLLNVTLNDQREITNVFAGDLIESHRRGCEFVKKSAMQPVDGLYDVVVSTNSGYPLDLNLYQSVKGMSAAARIVKEGGTIILAAECCEGLPPGSSFEKLMKSGRTSIELLQLMKQSPVPFPEQWQVQIQTLIQQRANVLIYSKLSDEEIRTAHLSPSRDIAADVRSIASRQNGQIRVAVLPQGPLTIPYVRGQ